MKDVLDNAWERRLAAGLAENEGGSVPPDVTAAVLARVANGDTEGAQRASAGAARSPVRTGWLAAMMLLGCGAVAGVWSLQHQGAVPPAEAPAQGPRIAPDWRRVTSRAELDALPPDVKFVATYNLGDDDLEALARCRQIEGLRLAAGTSMPGQPRRLLTVAGLRHLTRFAKLRVLELDWQIALQDQSLDALADLPLVEELALSRFDTTDQALAVIVRMPSLRALDLTLNHGFRGDGVSSIAKVPGLRSLRLLSCSQLSVPMLAPLAGTRLQRLDLHSLGRGMRGIFVDGDQSDESQRRAAMLERAKLDGAGVTPAVALPPSLRTLGIAGIDFDDAAVAQVIERLPNLEELDLSGNERISDAGVAATLRSHPLRKLDLSRCSALTDAIVDVLASNRSLRCVELQGLPWVTDAVAASLAATGKEVAISRDPSTHGYPEPSVNLFDPSYVKRIAPTVLGK